MRRVVAAIDAVARAPSAVSVVALLAPAVASLQSTILKIFSKNMGKHLVVSEIVATFAIAYEK